MSFKTAALILALTGAGAPVLAQAATIAPTPAQREPVVAVTHHAGTFNGERIGYTATVAETFLRDTQGAPTASVITIAYTRDSAGDPSRRPVMFVFNGGPGASSSPLHMSALGPVRRTNTAPDDRTSAKWGENPFSPLDAVDLVFVDPVGTGFSRAFPGADTRAWYSADGDALEVKSVISAWLKTNHREASPRFLAGESYGTTRAALIVKHSQDLPFDGVLLIALVGEAPGREMPYVVTLPTMAAGAWYHERIDRKGRSVAQVYDEAVRFARTDYVSALIQGASLPSSEKHRIAVRMSSLIGLPADLIERNDLRISKNTWMFNLLKDKTLRTGLLDLRVTAPLEPGQLGDIDDPALGVAPKRAAGAPAGPPPSAASIGAVQSPVVGAYLTQALKFPSSETYYGVNFTVNAAWNREGMEGAISALGAAMRADPKIRLFWAAGYFDLTTPAYEARYTLDQDGVPGDRLTAAYFPGPHGVYAGEENLRVFTDAVRRFVRPAAGAR